MRPWLCCRGASRQEACCAVLHTPGNVLMGLSPIIRRAVDGGGPHGFSTTTPEVTRPVIHEDFPVILSMPAVMKGTATVPPGAGGQLRVQPTRLGAPQQGYPDGAHRDGGRGHRRFERIVG
jgi:hypothetical protein